MAEMIDDKDGPAIGTVHEVSATFSDPDAMQDAVAQLETSPRAALPRLRWPRPWWAAVSPVGPPLPSAACRTRKSRWIASARRRAGS